MKKKIFVISVVLLMLFATVIPCFANTRALTGKALIESYGLSVKAYGTTNDQVSSAAIDSNGRLVVAAGGTTGNIFVGTDLGDFSNVLKDWTIEAKLTGVSVADNWHYGIAYNNNKFNTPAPSMSLRAGVYTEGKDWGQILCTAKTKTEKPYKLGEPSTPFADMSAANGNDHVFSVSFDSETKMFTHKLNGVEVAKIYDNKNETSLSEFNIMIPNRQTVGIVYMRVMDGEGNIIYNEEFEGNGSGAETGVKHNVTVKYLYADGTVAAPAVTKQVAEGMVYSVKSPAIDGFLPDKELVYAKMGTTDITITVTYSVPITLTIHYVKADGSKMFDDYVIENLAVGAPYSVTSKSVAYFAINKQVVAGVAGDSNIEVTVVYTPIPKQYTLTIQYLYADDHTLAAETHVSEYMEGTSYSVTSPVIAGYTPNQAIVSADRLDSDLSIVVFYTVGNGQTTNPDPINPDPINPEPESVETESKDTISADSIPADGQNQDAGCGAALNCFTAIPMALGAAWILMQKDSKRRF